VSINPLQVSAVVETTDDDAITVGTRWVDESM